MQLTRSFLYYKPPTTEENINAWEKLVSIQIPEQYRTFLLQSNGADGSAEWGFTFTNSAGEKTSDGLFWLYGIEELTGAIKEIKEDEIGGYRPGYHLDELIPIGQNYCHSSITMIGYKGDDYGKIILLDYAGYTDSTGDLMKIYLADSFEDFLQMFYKIPGYDE